VPPAHAWIFAASVERAKEGWVFHKLCKFGADENGVTALEYALIAALVAVVIIGGVSLLGTNISSVFSTVANTI
jgi:pilus assembly protein Flp/PilA